LRHDRGAWRVLCVVLDFVDAIEKPLFRNPIEDHPSKNVGADDAAHDDGTLSVGSVHTIATVVNDRVGSRRFLTTPLPSPTIPLASTPTATSSTTAL